MAITGEEHPNDDAARLKGTPPAAQLRIVHPDPKYSKPKLIEPTRLGYIYLASVLQPGPLPLVLPSTERSALLRKVKELARELEKVDTVMQVHVFRAIVVPPTRFSYLRERGNSVYVANFDVMVLVQTTSPTTIREVQATAEYATLADVLSSNGRALRTIAARNVRRINDIDTTRPGLFLFNHFAARDARVMLELWEYLAGWYVQETGLDNSVALAPLEGEASDYAIVNWARWTTSPVRHFWNQLSKPSFRSYVLANLEANQAASMPIYCLLV